MASLWHSGWFWHPYSQWNVSRRGKRDGRKTPPIPPWDATEQPPFLMVLKQAGDSDVRALVGEWARLDDHLKEHWENACETSAREKEQLARIERQHEEVEKRYRDTHDGAPAPTSGDSRFIGYWLLIAVLFITEFPMNAIVFRLFGENEVFTYVATGAIAVALLASAHFLGAMLREGAAGNRVRVGMIGVLIALPVGVIAAVAYLRERYLEKMADSAQGLGSGSMWFAFAAFNLLIFIVAAVMSYRVHDEAFVAVVKSAKRLAGARARCAEADTARVKAEVSRKKIWDGYRQKCDQVKDAVQRLTEVYRTHNLEHRADRGDPHQSSYPRSFGQYVEVTVPKELVELDWSDTDVRPVATG